MPRRERERMAAPAGNRSIPPNAVPTAGTACMPPTHLACCTEPSRGCPPLVLPPYVNSPRPS